MMSRCSLGRGVALAWVAAIPCFSRIALADGPTTQPSKQELIDRMNAMQSQMDSLQSQLKQTQAALTQTQQQEQANQAKQAVISDADQRSTAKFDSSAIVGGWDPATGFTLESADGNTVLHPIILSQGNLAVRSRGGDDTTGRLVFGFDGSLFTKDLTYDFRVNVGPDGENLENVWTQYVYDHNVWNNGDLAIKGGLLKDPLYKETGIIDDGNQLLVHFSLANALTGVGVQGGSTRGVDFLFLGNNTPLHGEVAFTGGPSNTQYLASDFGGIGGQSDFAFTSRVDYKFNGDWTDTNDLTGKKSGQHDLLDIGGGIAYTDADESVWRASVDGQYMIAKQWTAFAAIYFDHIDDEPTIGSRTDGGGVIEGGYMISPELQAVARYSLTLLDSDAKVNGEDKFNELSVGANWYMGPNGSWGNRAKLSVDVTWLPKGSPADADLDYTNTAGHDVLVFRGQFQLWL